MRFFKLKFKSALHVDSKGSGNQESLDEFIHSDTLSAALCISRKTLYPEDTNQDYFLNPPFTVSSAFPYIGDVLFFPCPAWRIWGDIDIAKRKEIKKVRWISKGLLEKVLNGNELQYADVKALKGGVAVSREEYKDFSLGEEEYPWQFAERQRVSVDRVGCGDGQTFFFALQFFAPSSGLFFLVSGNEDEAEKSLHFLADSGIGADRNSGLGHFEACESGIIDINAPKSADGAYTLSLFNPSANEDVQELVSTSAYLLQSRSGWVHGSTAGRPPIRVFAEGSYLSGKPSGRVVPMLPEHVRERYSLDVGHSAPRDFRAFSLPCKQPGCLKEVCHG